MLLKELLKVCHTEEKDFEELKDKQIIASKEHEFGYIIILDDFTSIFIYLFTPFKQKSFSYIKHKTDLKQLIKNMNKTGKILNKQKYEQFKQYIMAKQV